MGRKHAESRKKDKRSTSRSRRGSRSSSSSSESAKPPPKRERMAQSVPSHRGADFAQAVASSSASNGPH
eukprot:6750553-Karenia_brevis.AAC.1